MGSEKPEITQEQISVILRRAAELDAKGETLSAEELTEIAEEAGIDPTATARAIREVVGSRAEVAPSATTPPAP